MKQTKQEFGVSTDRSLRSPDFYTPLNQEKENSNISSFYIPGIEYDFIPGKIDPNIDIAH